MRRLLDMGVANYLLTSTVEAVVAQRLVRRLCGECREAYEPAAELARELAAGESWLSLCGRIVRSLPEHVYLSVDIDGLDPSLCPNTGTPVPGGLSWADANLWLEELAASYRPRY